MDSEKKNFNHCPQFLQNVRAREHIRISELDGMFGIEMSKWAQELSIVCKLYLSRILPSPAAVFVDLDTVSPSLSTIPAFCAQAIIISTSG